MLLKDIQTIFHKELDAEYGNHEVDSFFNILIKHYLDLERISLVLEPNLNLTKTEEQPLFEALVRLKNHEPIQYIIGETEFFGLNFKVNENTLIPRPETEELVEWIVGNATSNTFEKPLNILDIGTGTGCIAISLANSLPNAQVTAIDISEGALKVAEQNANLNNADVTFVKADILDRETTIIEPRKWDVIVSNPPYVRNLEKAEMKKNVLNYEPSSALFVSDDNPLLFYKAIVEFAVDNLKENGLLFFEINQYLGQETKELLADYGFRNIQLKKDIFGNDRMVNATK